METLKEEAAKLGINLGDKELGQFSAYLSALKKWNEHTNLTSITSDTDIISKHFLDSLTVLQTLPKDAQTLIDIGTGAGFPGLPLKIALPELRVTLLDATAKKTAFLESLVKELGLKDVSVINARAEDVAHDAAFRERFDSATARAVAGLPALCELALPFVRLGGVFIAQKSAGSEEISESADALHLLGAGEVRTIPVSSDRQLVVIEKNSPTPEKYPRRAGMPAKRPL